MRKALLFYAFILGILLSANGQNKIIDEKEVAHMERILAADSMQGRKIFTPGIEKATYFIEQHFEQAGLQPLPGNKSLRQDFFLLQVKPQKAEAVVQEKKIPAEDIFAITTREGLHWTQESPVKAEVISANDDFFEEFRKYLHPKENTIVWINKKFVSAFKRVKKYFEDQTGFPSSPSVVFILSDKVPSAFKVDITNQITRKKATNIVGMLPGKARPEEYVVFSAHYDHLGIGEAVNGDSIYNGANDDASGTTAVMALATYFKEKNNHARSLIFAAFTGEEEGGYGSRYFSKQLDPDKVVAMFNIEMIGTESKWGKNSAYITGFDKSDLGKILQKNLEGTDFQFYPDPYPGQNLFYRSDNATLARLGVPAHTISTSKMDHEPNYHKVSDEVSTLDLNNMTHIIRAIALSARSIISSEDTPSRVEVSALQ